jgi:hypothetical protein
MVYITTRWPKHIKNQVLTFKKLLTFQFEPLIGSRKKTFHQIIGENGEEETWQKRVVVYGSSEFWFLWNRGKNCLQFLADWTVGRKDRHYVCLDHILSQLVFLRSLTATEVEFLSGQTATLLCDLVTVPDSHKLSLFLKL